jgi:hypothetical protein
MKVNKYSSSKATFFVDTSSGELIDDNVTNEDKFFFKNDGFVIVYSEFFSLDLSPAELKCIFTCFSATVFNSNIIKLDGDRKLYNNIYKVLPRLIKINLIIKLDKGRYMVNPVYFWKGFSQERFKLLEELYNTHKYIFDGND